MILHPVMFLLTYLLLFLLTGIHPLHFFCKLFDLFTHFFHADPFCFIPSVLLFLSSFHVALLFPFPLLSPLPAARGSSAAYVFITRFHTPAVNVHRQRPISGWFQGVEKSASTILRASVSVQNTSTAETLISSPS